MTEDAMIVAPMEWRQWPRFPDYEVSECGDVRRPAACRTRPADYRLRGSIDSDGYLRYTLIDRDGKKYHVAAHRIVAEAFLGPRPSPLHEVAHNNGSRVGLHYRMLRWALSVENSADTFVHGTVSQGEKNGRAKIRQEDVLIIRREYLEIKRSRGKRKVSELDERFGLNRGTIISIATGKSWSHIPLEPAPDIERVA